MFDPNTLAWENIVTQDWYRSSSAMDRAKAKSLWFKGIAPVMYPEIMGNPKGRAMLMAQMGKVDMPPKDPEEDSIILPDTLTMDAFSSIEANRLYQKRDYGGQQVMKHVWFRRMANNDPFFKSLPPDKQQNFYTNLMARDPTLSSRTAKMGTQVTSMLIPTDDPYIVKLGYEEADDPGFGVAVDTAVNTLMHSFLESFGSLFLGTVSGLSQIVAGKDNEITEVIRDTRKMQAWRRDRNKSMEFLTEKVPGFFGGVLGTAMGPYSMLHQGLAGSAAVSGITGQVTRVPGAVPWLFDKVGLKATPAIIKELAGGTAAGAIQGAARAIMQEDPEPLKRIGQDALFGMGWEFLSRYVGAMWQIRKVAKALDTTPRNILTAPFKLGDQRSLPWELDKILKVHPDFMDQLATVHALNELGIPLEFANTREGAAATAGILGYKVKFEDNVIKLMKGRKIINRFEGPENHAIDQLMTFLDTDQAAWDTFWDTAKGKSISEIFATAPSFTVRKGQFVPEEGRKALLQAFKENKVPISLTDYGVMVSPVGKAPKLPKGTKVPKIKTEPIAFQRGAGTENIDDVFGIIRNSSARKAASALSARGITFDDSPETNLAILKDLRAKFRSIVPDSPYIISNTVTQKIVNEQDLPVKLFHSPDVKQPFHYEGVFNGPMHKVVEQLRTYKKTYSNMLRATTRLANRSGMDLRRYNDNGIVELSVQLRDSSGALQDFAIHFPSEKQALEFLTQGSTKGMSAMSKHLFKDVPQMQKYMDGWVREMSKTSPDKIAKDYLPFRFTFNKANEAGMTLSMFRGKYLLLDFAGDPTLSTYHILDDLKSVNTYLDKVVSKRIMPDLFPELSQVGVEALYPNGIKDPLQNIEDMPIKTRDIRMRDAIPLNMAPGQYMPDRFAKLEGVAKLREEGIDMATFWNMLQDSQRAVNAFFAPRARYISNLSKQINKREMNYLYRYIQALDSPDEIQSAIAGGAPPTTVFGLKSEVADEIVKRFGPERLKVIQSVAADSHNYFTDLFNRNGLDWNAFRRHYLPRIQHDMKDHYLAGTRVGRKAFDGLPENVKDKFYQFFADIDPKKAIYEENTFKMMQTYTHLTGRSLYMEKTVTDIGKIVNEVTGKLAAKGATPEEYRLFTEYLHDTFNVILGNRDYTESVLTAGATNSYRNILSTMKNTLMKGGKYGEGFADKIDLNIDPVKIVDKMMGLTTAAHLGMRPFSALKNLTQSLVTGMPLIGTKYWFEGLDAVTTPGNMARMENLGLFSVGTLPVGGGIQFNTDGFVGTTMKMFSGADRVNRGVVYLGMEKRFQDAVDLYKLGEITKNQFFRMSGMRKFGSTQFNDMARIFNTSKNLDDAFTVVKDRVARLAVDRTQYNYDMFNRPQLFRNTIGTMFGQYTSWPMNFYNLGKNLMGSDSMSFAEKAATLFRFTAATSAIAYGFHQLGVDATGFLPHKMMFYQGGPWFQMGTDLLAGINGDQQAFAKFARNFSRILPLSYAGEGMYKAYQAMEEGDMHEAFIHLMTAPPRMDIYPQREMATDLIEENIRKFGDKWIKFHAKKLSDF